MWDLLKWDSPSQQGKERGRGVFHPRFPHPALPCGTVTGTGEAQSGDVLRKLDFLQQIPPGWLEALPCSKRSCAEVRGLGAPKPGCSAASGTLCPGEDIESICPMIKTLLKGGFSPPAYFKNYKLEFSLLVLVGQGCANLYVNRERKVGNSFYSFSF